MGSKRKTASLSEIASSLGRNPSSVSRQLHKAGVKCERGKIDVDEAKKIIADASKRNGGHGNADHESPSNKYKLLQCKRILLEIERIEGRTIERELHLSKLQALAQIQRDGFAQFVSLVKVQTGDKRLVEIAEKIRDEVFAKMTRAVKGE